MRQIIYTLQFKGQTAPANESGSILKAAKTAPSCTISTVVGSTGVSGTLKSTDGGKAKFESEVAFTGDTTFQESGIITFGEEGHRLHFNAVGQGHIGPSSDPKLQHGSVIWKIERGEGQFEGATGLITSNFTVSEAGEVTDNHFGVIFLQQIVSRRKINLNYGFVKI